MSSIYANGRTPEERFWAQVDRSGGPDACWPWTGMKTSRGYGQVRIGGKREMATRVSLRLAGRPPFDGEDACHRCDNPPCVNPAHLFAAPRLVNHADMRSKGRSAPGERRWNAVLTADAVRSIRQAAAAGISHAELARRYSVGRRSIGKVVDRSLWARVR